jgi:Mce-associated membrane protein
VENQGDNMAAREDRRLKLIKGAAATGGAGSGRPVRRREVTRRTPREKDPVTAILERLDDEPVEAADEPLRSSERAAMPPGQAVAGAAAVDDEGVAVPTAVDDEDVAGPAAVDDEDVAGPAAVDDEDVAGPETHDGAAVRRRRTFPTRRELGRGHLAGGILVAVLCAALTAAGTFGHRWYSDRALDGANQQALAAAKQTTVNFVSVSASSVDRDLQRIVDGATGEFKDQFTRGQSEVRAAIVENKVESRGSVLRAGLVSGDRRTAVVLVAVDATVKNVHAPDGRPSHYRIQVDVTRDAGSGKWLVSRLQFVG